MNTSSRDVMRRWITVFQTIAMYVLGAMTLVAIAATVLAAFGVFEWPQLALSYADAPIANIGMFLQIGVTVILTALCFYLPANARIMRLEHAHRDFSISMDDVARAYTISHQADRTGAFALSSEFDSVRERIAHLRDHPDLATLEPGVLEVAAQMSRQSGDLANIYSDEKVDRAKVFLRQRQEEIQAMKDRIGIAQMTCDELRRWRQDVAAEERVVGAQLERLEKDLREVLPTLGYDLEGEPANVFQIAKPNK